MVPKSKLKAGPILGEFAIQVLKHYQDLNSYAFATPDILKFSVPKELPPEVQLAIRTHQTSDNEFTSDFSLVNLTDRKTKIEMHYLLPKEVELLTPTVPFELPPKGQINSSFQFKNKTGLQGSNYQIVALAEWADSHRHLTMAYSGFGIRPFVAPASQGTEWTMGSFKIFFQRYLGSDQVFGFYWLAGLFLGLIAIWQFWLRPLSRL